ncbi:MAG: peptidoglycan-binding protein [Acidimicrobiia bacterium]
MLARSAQGEAVLDLQRRLQEHGLLCDPDPSGTFGEGTARAVGEFQKTRGLPVDGICGDLTWHALVESGFCLGDRLLYVRTPRLRGDDVAELQHRLNALGFDAGREDGIFGDATAHALREFQRNAGVAVDAICGPASVLALARLGTLAGGSVASVRESHALRTDVRDLPSLRISVIAPLGLAALAEAVAHALRREGATVDCDTNATELSDAAATANRFEADLALALDYTEAADPTCRYYGTARFRSARGEALARCVLIELARLGLTAGTAVTSSVGFTRETRMPAVLCELPIVVATRAEHAPTLTDGLVRAIEAAFQPPAQH